MPARKKSRVHPVVRAVKTIHRHAKDHFIPHKGNNYTPHVLQHRVLFGYSVALVLLKAIVITVSVALPSASVFSSAITPTNIVNLANESRRDLNLTPLSTDSRLMHAAQAKAEDMLANQYFAHTSPSGTTPWVWIRNAGYVYSVSGENLAVHYTSAENAFSGWLASPSHRANIVNPKFIDTGVGVAQGLFEGYPSILVVQMFGRPRDGVAPIPEPPKAVKTVATNAPIIKTDDVKVTPSQTGVTVKVPIENASSAVAQLGDTRIRLAATTSSNVWKAEVPAAAIAAGPSGDVLSVTAWDAHGNDTGETLASISPIANTQAIFAPPIASISASYRLFGIIPLDGLRDNVRQIYLITIVLLASCLTIAVLVKYEIQRPTMIVHTMIVIGLSVILATL